jgi:hypothetical protein
METTHATRLVRAKRLSDWFAGDLVLLCGRSVEFSARRLRGRSALVAFGEGVGEPRRSFWAGDLADRVGIAVSTCPE